MARIRVAEMFSSLQGESTFAGRPCFFIRLSGCSLRCSYCDTRFAQPAETGRTMTVEAAVAAAREAGLPLVEVTGGEPLEQDATPELLRQLLADGREVLLETNGAQPLERVPEGVRRIVDYKLPSSGMTGRMLAENFRMLNAGDEVKFVIADRADYDCARRVVADFGLAEQTANLLFSPVWGRVNLEDLAGWLVADRMPGRMQIQMHKIIWGPTRNGV